MLTDVGAGTAIVLTEAVPIREGETVFVPAAAGGLGSSPSRSPWPSAPP
jgi:NADPH:quinone reductase-like Zn-dependent oxidoreductase